MGSFALRASAVTDAGKKRDQNEDAFVILERHAVYAVADGMGGLAAGEVASRVAIETMTTAFDTGRFEGPSVPQRARRADELVRSIQMANTAVRVAGLENRSAEGMGTTVVALSFARAMPRGWVAHVGDSRAYRHRAGRLELLTRDHTLGFASGMTGPAASKLMRAIGAAPELEVDLAVVEVRAGDRYLLCTDGLNKMIDDAAIMSVLDAEPNPDRAAALLVERANEAGGRDNVTVLLVDVSAAPAR